MRFDLDAIDAPVAAAGPRMIALGDIDEDPEQPRSEFDDASLRELAVTIAERGVKQPVSVRPHPHDEGRWMLNFGARRLRAARLAGLGEIPAFVDEAVDRYDQVIENEQREGLKPLELALFVQRRLTLGESQTEIARRLGKSKTLVTMIGALIDAPDWLLEVYRSGRCRGIAELYELRRLHENDPQVVQVWIYGREKVSRAELLAFKAGIKGDDAQPVGGLSGRAAVPVSGPDERAAGDGPVACEQRDRQDFAKAAVRANLSVDRAVVLQGQVDGQAVRVLLEEVPPEPAHVTVDFIERHERRAIALTRVKTLRLVEETR